MSYIREWRNEEWDTTDKARTQEELQYMARKIINNASEIEDKPTPGCSRDNLSRCLVCKSDLRPNTEYIIHIEGFEVEDIVEIIRE